MWCVSACGGGVEASARKVVSQRSQLSAAWRTIQTSDNVEAVLHAFSTINELSPGVVPEGDHLRGVFRVLVTFGQSQLPNLKVLLAALEITSRYNRVLHAAPCSTSRHHARMFHMLVPACADILAAFPDNEAVCENVWHTLNPIHEVATKHCTSSQLKVLAEGATGHADRMELLRQWRRKKCMLPSIVSVHGA